ncbi:MAG: hypothetical protein BGO97_14910 [Micrococcales bacterium 70-64]|nr:hypothetical protein [Leifsonia sp.]ODU65199.1 MAG: hypothetical protein ABT06_14910 [Leifsonia sp. SCN 70-46]OJX86891.1 MAG: hypothetical protein BGO97_14910 [Micrococcales bacterium 70-64]
MTIEPAAATTGPVAAVPRPRNALGIVALVCAVLAPVWAFSALYLVVGATQESAPGPVVVLANILAFGFIVCPLAALAALVLGIVAIVLRRGRPFGAAALVVLALSVVGVVVYIAAAFQAFS